eukprot:sb/3471578/
MTRRSSEHLLPIYTKQVECSRKMADNSAAITQNVSHQLSAATDALLSLQKTIQENLQRPQPVLKTSGTQTEFADTLTAITPMSSPRKWETDSGSTFSFTTCLDSPMATICDTVTPTELQFSVSSLEDVTRMEHTATGEFLLVPDDPTTDDDDTSSMTGIPPLPEDEPCIPQTSPDIILQIE